MIPVREFDPGWLLETDIFSRRTRFLFSANSYQSHPRGTIMEKEILERIQIMQGDITTLEVDAIVNAANKSLLGGGGVDGAIHRAAGPELLAYCRTLGGCETGEAKITMGYNLPARYVIHTVGPVYSGRPEDKDILARCYQNSLQLAVDHDVVTIAFPAISCGVYGYPIDEASKIAIDTTCEFLKSNKSIEGVIFVLFSAGDFRIYKDYLEKISSR